MAGLWKRFKLWMRRQALRLVWRIASTRLYRALRSLVSASLVPLLSIGLGSAFGVAVAAAAAFPLGFGALIGMGSVVVAFVALKVGNKIHQKIRSSHHSRRNSVVWKKETSIYAASSSKTASSSRTASSSKSRRF